MIIATFILLQGVLIAAALLAAHFTVNTKKGQIALFIAMLFCGALLTYFGKIYQPDGHGYQLLMTWAILIFPWLLVARIISAWCLWLGMLNLALWLYLGRAGFALQDGVVASLFLVASIAAVMFWRKRERLSSHKASTSTAEPRLVDHNTVHNNRGGLILIGLMLILAVVNQGIWKKEHQIDVPSPVTNATTALPK